MTRQRLEELAEAGKLYDKHGREIMLGDIVKVFHFVGRRRKHFYMYKQVVDIGPINAGSDSAYLTLSHLDMGRTRHYHEYLDGRALSTYEIVQSVDAAFERRPRRPQPPEGNQP